jgi:hypothetical protein
MKTMKERRMTTSQARWLQGRIRPVQALLRKVHERLVTGRYERRLIETVSKAHQEISTLNVALHYESIKEGIGNPPKEE